MSDVIRLSYDKIAPHTPEVMEALYRKLFARMPKAREMFPVALGNQYGKFGATLQLCVMEEAEPHAVDAILTRLGQKHDLRGVVAEDFPVFIDCFIEAIAEQLGAEWNDVLDEAWRRTMTAIARRMMPEGRLAQGAA